MKIQPILSACLLSILVLPVTGAAAADFEQPVYNLGPWSGQSGGGIVWWEYEADSSGDIIAGGYNSPQAARLGVDELPNPQSGALQSDGDDMLGFFAQAEHFIISGMSYAHLNPAPANGGKARYGALVVGGAALVWGANGNVLAGSWPGANTNLPIAYDQWVPFSVHIDHAAQHVVMHYNGQQILDTALTGWATYSNSFNIWLDTIPLSNNPDGDDYLLFDNLAVQPIPEPATLAMLGMGGLAWLRRRR